VVAVRSIKDADAFKAGVIDKASPAVLAAAGGRYVVRTQTIRSLDGPSPERFVLLAFDSVTHCRSSSRALRTRSAEDGHRLEAAASSDLFAEALEHDGFKLNRHRALVFGGA
jgi:uncharacterized protein (DUF1330 family)